MVGELAGQPRTDPPTTIPARLYAPIYLKKRCFVVCLEGGERGCCCIGLAGVRVMRREEKSEGERFVLSLVAVVVVVWRNVRKQTLPLNLRCFCGVRFTDAGNDAGFAEVNGVAVVRMFSPPDVS
ncbi:hypothetical protein O3P69_004575 [Scylla paramamosain]|uniref:Uncharacterized protein n=1 Tax=Scylla paramamosain TaxID=85552 RepID=A0AAW0UEY9_SCYPA